MSFIIREVGTRRSRNKLSFFAPRYLSICKPPEKKKERMCTALVSLNVLFHMTVET